MNDKIIKVHFQDGRLESIHEKILDVIYENAIGISLASILGVLELVKKELIESQEEAL